MYALYTHVIGTPFQATTVKIALLPGKEAAIDLHLRTLDQLLRKQR